MPASPTMDVLVAGLATKSAKIRALGSAGYSRSEIADYLGIRYQHVRNVLKDAERTGESRAAQPELSDVGSAFEPAGPQKLVIGPQGELRIPAILLQAVGAKPGDVLLVRLEDDDLRLCTPAAAAKRVQALIRKTIPQGVSLADELIAERRGEAEREKKNA